MTGADDAGACRRPASWGLDGERRSGARRAARLVGLAVLLALGCAPIPPPDILAELDAVRAAAAVVEARELVPSAVRSAELLRVEANVALEQGDFARAQILGERARASYFHAVALGRVAKAQRQEAEALADVEAMALELASVDVEQQQVAAELGALELRLAQVRGGVAGDGQGRSAGGPHAIAAVRAVRLQAALSCAAARLLRPAAATVESKGELEGLEQRLRTGEEGLPLTEAVELRSACLRHLTSLRRALAMADPPPAAADELLERLAELDVGEVRRDERGIVVTIREPFERTGVAATVRAKLVTIGELARRHPQFPLLLVLHESAPPDGRASATGLSAARAKVMVDALGVDVSVELAGDALPVLPTSSRYAKRNDRVEIVLVSPSLL